MTIISVFISFQLSQTALILYKIGRLEESLNELKRRINLVEERVM